MVKFTIDNKTIEAKEGTTILEAARAAGLEIPTLCYLKDINEIGACRVCVVEIEGCPHLAASCNTPVADGMVIHTNSPRVREARRTNLQLILAEHDTSCTTCTRSGNCTLQSLANNFALFENLYEVKPPRAGWDMSFPLIREEGKCIKCLRCVSVCDKIQSLNVWKFNGSGYRAHIEFGNGINPAEANCSLCGQCVTHCPTGALHVRIDTEKAVGSLTDPDKVTIVQVAPAVRAAWGEGIGLSPSAATEKRLVAVLKELGFKYVFDTSFTADLTIMEEASEFLERIGDREHSKLPLFTSCCPGWVRFLKMEYPELLPNLSSAKSPQQMFGAVSKTYWAKKMGIDPSKIVCISIMPCMAKKYECSVETVNSAGVGRDVDCVLTTRELDRIIKASHIDPAALPEEEFDKPLGDGSGAAVIFGASGGVMEAALRSAYFFITGKNPDPDAFRAVRGTKGWKEIEADIGEIHVRAAVVSGLSNARALIEALKNGEASYDFVEVMACPGGCAGGGGQPIEDGCELAGVRGKRLYNIDAKNPVRFSHENPSIIKLYDEFLGKPLGHKSHELLHTKQGEWKL
jgi:NADH-quinone oxidoreductase subunit G